MLILVLFLVFIAPVKVNIALDGTALSLRVSIWGIAGSFHPTLASARAMQPTQPAGRLLGTILRTDKARRFLISHVRLLRLDALVRIGIWDAARTALLTGFLRQLARLLPHETTDVRFVPDFSLHSGVQARCILHFRLGTIIITAAMALTAWFLEGREHPKSRPEEA